MAERGSTPRQPMRAGGHGVVRGEDCPWLLVERQRLVKHGFRLGEIPSLLAHGFFAPATMLFVVLRSAGYTTAGKQRRIEPTWLHLTQCS